MLICLGSLPSSERRNSAEPLPAPRWKISSRLLAAQLGPSSAGPLVRLFSSVPSGLMMPMLRPAVVRCVKAIHSPSGLQSGQAYQAPPKLIRRWFDPSEFIT
jgi:hypothetical protein